MDANQQYGNWQQQQPVNTSYGGAGAYSYYPPNSPPPGGVQTQIYSQGGQNTDVEKQGAIAAVPPAPATGGQPHVIKLGGVATGATQGLGSEGGWLKGETTVFGKRIKKKTLFIIGIVILLILIIAVGLGAGLASKGGKKSKGSGSGGGSGGGDGEGDFGDFGDFGDSGDFGDFGGDDGSGDFGDFDSGDFNSDMGDSGDFGDYGSDEWDTSGDGGVLDDDPLSREVDV